VARSLTAAGLLAGLVGAAGFGYWVTSPAKAQRTDLILHKVRLEPLQLTVVERGALESADNREVHCRVRGGTKATDLRIKWVIDDGAQVKQGERLMEIEDSALQDQLKAQKIVVDQARSAMIAAEQQYKITVSQNDSNIRNAEIAVILAELDLKKYLEGDYLQSLRAIEGAIKVAEADFNLQKERMAWADRMKSRDYFSQSQFNSEESRLRSLEVAWEKAKEDKRVLEDYTKKRTVTDLTTKLDEAKKILEREKDKAKAEEIKAESERQAKKSVFEQEEDKYEDIEEQIRRCIITAPQDGMVVYFVSEQSRYGSGSQQSIIAQGEPVREGQKLMRIPDLRRMLVNTKVHEAMVSRIKGDIWQPTGFVDTLRAAMMFTPDGLTRLLGQHAVPDIRDRMRDYEMKRVFDGMRASIRIDAFPDRTLQGHVKSVATVASQQDWMSADVKLYQTMVAIDESLENLKPGMSAEVTIFVEGTGEQVLTVPIQAVVGGAEMGRKRKVYVNTPEGPKDRDVVLGLSNEKVVEVKEGLKEGEEVIINPRALLGDRVKTRQANENGRGDGGPGGEGKAKGKGKGRGQSKGFPKDMMPDGMPPMDGPGDLRGGPGVPPNGRMGK
jgi:HlyD family secretion protein